MIARVTGLEDLDLTEPSFLRLGLREVLATVYLRSYELTPGVQKLPPSRRFAYLAARVERWIDSLRSRYPGLSLQAEEGRLSRIPQLLSFRGPAREVFPLADSPGVWSVHVTKVAGYRRRRARKPPLVWYCLRALVIIRVEQAKAGMQNTEDRFVLVRASSFEDAKKRLRQHWREYATPYLNSEGQMVSWSLDNIINVYDTGETELDPAGTEVYSKLGHRRMRPEYVWRPRLASL